VLLLEDEHAIADTIVYAFETDGFEITHVQTCMQALDLISSGGYDCAIFDVGLPDGTGFDLCKRVRRDSMIPILFLTARSDEIDRVVGLEIGGDDYVTKPFSPREVVARVKAILRRTEVRERESVVASSGLSFDSDRQVFRYNDVVVEFTRAELQLLITLFEAPQRVFTRDQLLDRINEDPGAAFDRVIDAHVKAIRAKLKMVSPDAGQLIGTRRGLGYFLDM